LSTLRAWTHAVARREFVPIYVLLAVGLALRVALSLVYRPAALNQYDANAYVWSAEGEVFGLFEGPFQAPGYSLFLRLPHLVTSEVTFTVSVQHLLGLGTGLLLWWIVRRLTGSALLGLIPAAFVLLDADALLLEHALMSETLFRFLVIAMVATALSALWSLRRWDSLALAGALLGAAIWVRYVALALIAVLPTWALAVSWPRWRRMLAGAAAAGAAAAFLVVAHIVLHGRETGFYGISETSGWALYSRTAEFADCEQFEPPPGTEALCQPNDPAVRHHPDWYGYNQRSPARRLFGGQPGGDNLLQEWARRAILAQPLDYLEVVWDDLTLYFFEEDWVNENRSLIGPRSVSFRLRTPDEHCSPEDCRSDRLGIEAATLTGWTSPDYGAYYEPFEPDTREGIEFFQGYQRVFRVHGPLMLILVLLSVAGLAAIRGPLAKPQWLLSSTGLVLLVFPTMTTTYNVRYGLAAVPVLAAAATLAPLALRDGAAWIPAGLRRLRRRFGGR
jgi:hypothetical protein